MSSTSKSEDSYEDPSCHIGGGDLSSDGLSDDSRKKEAYSRLGSNKYGQDEGWHPNAHEESSEDEEDEKELSQRNSKADREAKGEDEDYYQSEEESSEDEQTEGRKPRDMFVQKNVTFRKERRPKGGSKKKKKRRISSPSATPKIKKKPGKKMGVGLEAAASKLLQASTLKFAQDATKRTSKKRKRHFVLCGLKRRHPRIHRAPTFGNHAARKPIRRPFAFFGESVYDKEE